jgi:hypothetical protein
MSSRHVFSYRNSVLLIGRQMKRGQCKTLVAFHRNQNYAHAVLPFGRAGASLVFCGRGLHVICHLFATFLFAATFHLRPILSCVLWFEITLYYSNWTVFHAHNWIEQEGFHERQTYFLRPIDPGRNCNFMQIVEAYCICKTHE